MKDHIFSGVDIGDAIAIAAANLGLPKADLRYVVLDQGSAGGRGLKPTPARIAVLLEDARPEEAAAASARPSGSAPASGPASVPAPAANDPRAGLVETIRAVAEAGALEVAAELEETGEALLVRVVGKDRDFFLEPDGKAEVLQATEHLLLRLYGAQLQPQAVRLTGEGFRERRDEALAAEARRVAALVRESGEPHTMPRLNSYERRIVHMALSEEPGIATSSAGEGAERRLTVAPAGSGEGPGRPE
jgi:spoIIIJ-associated protein